LSSSLRMSVRALASTNSFIATRLPLNTAQCRAGWALA
jgi:hypothetical protein